MTTSACTLLLLLTAVVAWSDSAAEDWATVPIRYEWIGDGGEPSRWTIDSLRMAEYHGSRGTTFLELDVTATNRGSALTAIAVTCKPAFSKSHAALRVVVAVTRGSQGSATASFSPAEPMRRWKSATCTILPTTDEEE
jgi:hypothetical protein